MSCIKRPSSYEDEDDILKEQEKFLKDRTAPSVHVVGGGKKRPRHVDPMDLDVKSHLDAPQVSSPLNKTSGWRAEQSTVSYDDDMEKLADASDQHVTKVLKSIVERNVEDVTSSNRGVPIGAFPIAPPREKDLVPISGSKKMSIFAQQFARSDPSRFGLCCVPSQKNTVFGDGRIMRPASDFIVERSVTGKLIERKADKALDDDLLPEVSVMQCQESSVMETEHLTDKEHSRITSEIKEVYDENSRKLATLTEKEILAKQQEIINSSDPVTSIIVSYLRQKKNRHTEDATEVPELSKHLELPKKVESQAEISVNELPIKPNSKWVNMDKIEYEKLTWMKDLPPPTLGDQKTSLPARFDFEGKVVAEDSDVPVHLALHHHGEEPERAGYTLQELFILSRSANLQQRSLALTTIGRIITNAKRGEFVDCLSAGIIPTLMDGGLVFLLRWAVDESAEVTLSAAVGAIYALVVCEQDEVVCDSIFGWNGGCFMHELYFPIDDVKDPDEEGQETDAEVVKKDVIKGLLRMSLLERLRYILEVYRPSAPVVIQIMGILIRVARHSSEAAYQVFKCLRLMDVICQEFLPVTWPAENLNKPLSTAYGYPLASAIKLVRVLSSAGRHIASLLFSKYSLLRYVIEDPGAMILPLEVSYSICIESWRLWFVLLHYGLALDRFCDFYHIVMEKLTKLCSSGHSIDKLSAVFGSAILGVVETTVHCAAEVSSRSKSSGRWSHQPMETEEGSHSAPAIPSFSWSPVTGLMPMISDLTLQGLTNFTKSYFSKPYDLNITASCLNVLASYYGRITEQPGYNSIEVQKEVLSLYSDHLVPCMKSQAFSLSLEKIRNHSIFNCESTASTELTDSLLTLGSLIKCDNHHQQVLHPESTLNFHIGFSRLLIAVGKLHRDIVEKAFGLVLQHEETLQYVRKVCRTKLHSMATNYFNRFENQFQFYLIFMAKMKGNGFDSNIDRIDMTLYHTLALNLLTRLFWGDEHFCHDLLSTVVFNKEFLRDLSPSDDCTEVFEEGLSLQVHEPLTSATQQKIHVSKRDLTKDLCDHLPSMRSTYMTSAPVSPKQLVQSRNRWFGNCLECDSLVLGPVGQLLVPVDWVFLPLLQVHNINLNGSSSNEQLPSGLLTRVRDSVRTVYLLEKWRPDTLDTVSATLKLSRIMCTFLAGSDLFLDKAIHWYLAELMKLYCISRHLDRMDFTKPIPGIASFHDLYRQLVMQYEAVSYGDSLFGCFLLLPLQQHHSASLRSVLWDENVTALRSICISVKELLIPIERFLQPEECDLHILCLYYEALLSKSILPKRNPVPYLIAIHHLNRFFYTVEKKRQRLKHAMIKQILLLDNKELQHHLLYYKSFNLECDYTMEFYDDLPVIRQNTLKLAESSC